MTTPDPLLRMAEFIEEFGSAPEDAAILRAAHAVIEAVQNWSHEINAAEDYELRAAVWEVLLTYDAACKEIK